MSKTRLPANRKTDTIMGGAIKANGTMRRKMCGSGSGRARAVHPQPSVTSKRPAKAITRDRARARSHQRPNRARRAGAH